MRTLPPPAGRRDKAPHWNLCTLARWLLLTWATEIRPCRDALGLRAGTARRLRRDAATLRPDAWAALGALDALEEVLLAPIGKDSDGAAAIATALLGTVVCGDVAHPALLEVATRLPRRALDFESGSLVLPLRRPPYGAAAATASAAGQRLAPGPAPLALWGRLEL